LEYTYKGAGVDLEAGDETVKRIKTLAGSTFTKNVISEIGLFGGFYEPDLAGIKNPVLVSSVDGVGTKLKIAFLNNSHHTIGQDLVNHCVNDIAVCGAKPLFFLDYLAVGQLDPNIAEKVIEGFSIACRENGCALIGGETAEMPGFYAKDEYDVSGTIVGIVDKSKIINGRNITSGDVLIGFPSTGLHTNGYSLARKVLLERFFVNDFFPELNKTLGEELLAIHKSYLKLINGLKDNFEIKGFSHITGGGIIGNTKRILPKGLGINIDWKSWEQPTIFKFIQKTGNIPDEEMRSVFNLGIGLIAIVSKDALGNVKDYLKSIKEPYYVIGKID
jgi:phosphoribosylformylglycinamidine cyclo-ligase